MVDQQGAAEAIAPQGRIDRLEIEDFKSYRGLQRIGPFRNFTAVIGPNGSGKSNLMDAISFVLGVRTQQLRGNLRELLYLNTDGSGDADRLRRGHVSLIFVTSGGMELAFARHIVPASAAPDAPYSSQYRINDRVVSAETYSRKLEGYGILVKARNFLVFQGDIEHVAAMQPKDLTQLFEHISGSEALRKRYEELEQAKNEAEERQSFIFSKKKVLGAEKKQKREQKDEAERHVKLQQELDMLKRDYYLWQLYHCDHDMQRTQREMATQRQAVESAEAAAAAADARVNEKRREAAAATKERLLLERKANKRRAEVDKTAPAAAKLKEEAARLSKKLRSDERALEGRRAAAAAQADKVARLQAELQAAQEEQQALEEGGGGGGLQLAGSMLQEYHALKAEAGGKTSKLQADVDAQASAQQVDEEALAALQEQHDALAARLQQIEAELAATQAQRQAADAARSEAAAELAAAQRDISSLRHANRRTNTQREAYQHRMEEVERQLADAKADRKETERDRRMAAAVAAMKRLIPGVHGRVTELVSVSQRKYNLALAVVMGRDMDSVVVDDVPAAKACIQHLKEQRLQPMKFIPLQSVEVKPVQERLRTLGGSAKLALDVLQYAPHLERAFVHVCGNTLMCDGTEEARRLAYDGPERLKVVTVEGTLFSKDGLITGGMSSGMEARAQRWDDSALERLRQEAEGLERELAALPTARQAAEREQQLAATITRLEQAVALRGSEIEAADGKLARLQGEAAALRQKAAEREPEAAALREAVAQRSTAMAKLQQRINDITDRMFRAFSKKVGVDNVREYEEGALREAQRAAQKRVAAASKATKLQNEIEYESRTDHRGAIAEMEAAVAAARERLEGVRAKEADAAAARAAADKEAQERGAAVEELAAKAAAVEAEVKELRREATRCSGEAGKARRALSALEAALEAAGQRWGDLLQAAAVEQVALPYRDAAGGADGGADADAEAEDEDGAQAMDTDGGGEDGQRGGGGSSEQRRRPDFRGLKRAYTSTLGSRDREALDAQFRDSIEETAGRLARVAPNHKAIEQFDVVLERERAQQAELDEAHAAAADAARQFHEVRQQRHDLFSGAFEHVSSVIDSIYKELTRSHNQPLGGTAYLSCESTDEPFLAGLKFTAMPPTKRFRDMEQLSGGEKTVAALALLFAIHSYQPSPFFVLDEVDAALDATNVARVAAYIRQRTRPGAQLGFQSIVISLKDAFYDKADGLVGVARDNASACSATYTFDLERFN